MQLSEMGNYCLDKLQIFKPPNLELHVEKEKDIVMEEDYDLPMGFHETPSGSSFPFQPIARALRSHSTVRFLSMTNSASALSRASSLVSMPFNTQKPIQSSGLCQSNKREIKEYESPHYLCN
jgi:hypothetical protein